MKIKVEKKNVFTGHNGSVYSLDTGDEEHLVFSGSSDRIVTRWNLNTLTPENFAAKLPAIVYALCYVPEKKLLSMLKYVSSDHCPTDSGIVPFRMFS